VSDYKFEIGQRVTCGSSNCTVTHRYLSVNGHREYMVRWDGNNWEINRYESQLKPAQLRRGDVVQREQAGSIPRWAIVRSNNGHGATYRRSASDGMVLHASPGACRHSNNHACSCCDFDGYYADKYREQCPWWVADDE